MTKQKQYICIDLKSFYASVECVERGLNPLTTNLVVADASRTEKTICLATSPSLKSYGLGGRGRLFEVVQKIKEVNQERLKKARLHTFFKKSYDDIELKNNPSLEVSYIVAPPQMAKYLKVSANIYDIYLKYISPEDIHVYSIDEVFIDVTSYLLTYHKNAEEIAMMLIKDVLSATGITATAGIGTNMYLAKVAMDIVAKHKNPDANGVRMASLDEYNYRSLLWTHEPLTDFWRVGNGISKRLANYGIYTMGDIARVSLGGPKEYYNEELLFKEFGINAELLIDHAWGYEPVTMQQVKQYKPMNNSLSTGQVLHEPYSFEKTRLIVKEMIDLFALDMTRKHLVTNMLVLSIGYDLENLEKDFGLEEEEMQTDFYGRAMPRSAHGTIQIGQFTSSGKLMTKAILTLFDRIVDKRFTSRRINICAGCVIPEEKIPKNNGNKVIDLFSDPEEILKEEQQEKVDLEKEKNLQMTLLHIKDKYGKNAALKGMNLEEGGTTVDRNKQIGGHKA